MTCKQLNICLMQVKSIAECSKGSILQYFRPSFSYHLSLSIFKWPLKTGFAVVPECLGVKYTRYETYAMFVHLSTYVIELSRNSYSLRIFINLFSA